MPRVTLRPLTADDAPALHPAFADPAVMQYWHTPRHADVAATRREIESMPSWWAIIHQDAVIGCVGYVTMKRRAGMGYLLGQRYWHQGLAQEAVEEAVRYATHPHFIDLWIHERNIPSQKLAQRCGFQFSHRFLQNYHNGLAQTFVFSRQLRPAPDMLGIIPTLLVSNVPDSIRYYRELGFEVTYETDGFAIISNGVEIHLRTGTPTKATLTIPIRGTLRAPTHHPWGLQEVVEDPDGYKLCFTTPA